MSVSRDHIDSFHRFALAQLDKLDADATIDELYDQWRLENPTREEQEADSLAVKAALRDMENGDRGMPFDEHLRQMRAKYMIQSRE